MSGICGIALIDQSAKVIEPQLAPMLQALSFDNSGDGRTVIKGAVGLGVGRFLRRCSGIASTTLHNRPIYLVVHGTLFGQPASQDLQADADRTAAQLLSEYLNKGMKFLCGIRGEFSLALWDGENEALYLATDPFRVHPIFYYRDARGLVFASRMKSLLAHTMVPRAINPAAIVDVVASSIVPTPHTVLRGVRKLPPGCFLKFHAGQVSVDKYWDSDFTQPARASEPELRSELKACFAESVSRRVAADPDLKRMGAFLSGGIDSSTVTGILTQQLGTPVNTFSIGFEEQSFNELEYARITAKAFNTKHHEYFVTPRDVEEALPIVIDAFDEPFANASAIPTYFCARLARSHGIDTLYAGDGGDELFAGNERYGSQRIFDYYSKVPAVLRNRLIRPAVFAIASASNIRLFERSRSYIRRAEIPYPDRLYSYGLFATESAAEWFSDEILDEVGRDYNPYHAIAEHYGQALADTELDRELYIDLKITISDNDLFKVTRMTEAAGVTVRYPFLDVSLAEFAARVPASMKMRGRELRSFFKRAYADLLPAEVIAKKKHGFGLPIPIWLRQDRRLNEMMRDLVLSPRSVQRGYFRRSALERLIAEHAVEEGSYYGTFLWNLMILELWHRRWIDDPMPSAPGRCPVSAPVI